MVNKLNIIKNTKRKRKKAKKCPRQISKSD